ncbi:MAG TPA: hypothetical protein VFL04_08770 [Rectinemataceae bacterium]|nr:hypothetical protein [Rectinemataceae bacterium]
MKKFWIAALVLLAAFAISSCTTFKASGLTVNKGPVTFTVLGNFQTDITVSEFLGAPAGAKLLNITANATEQAIADEIDKQIKAKGGTGVINLTIRHKASFFDILLSAITLSIYSPGTIEISGTVVK